MVTGASSGIGVDFANILAEFGCNLIIVARRLDRLEEQKKRLHEQYGIQVEVISMNLNIPDAPQKLYEEITNKDIEVEVLINNAGVGLYGNFVDISWEQEKDMLTLDIFNLVHLTKLFAKEMVKRNSGYILNVASIGAYQPAPTYASYSAAKSFVLYFTEALNYELRHTKVKITALSPGVTQTEFFKTAGQNNLTLFQKLTIMESYPVAMIGIKAMLKGKPSVIAGWMNALSIFFYRFMPRRLTTMIASFAMKYGAD
ncbi:MAG: SDR family oxidoreductase [Desulfobacterales bacterium]|nr:SDR family oxidoreductase [Desulfobacterales bacterium]